MFYTHRFQANRFEYKYLVSETQAQAIRAYVKGYLAPDDYAVASPDHAYDIHSLYLDNPQMSLCRATLDGLRNRVKIRIRFYDQEPTSPVFCEIKRRVNDAISKERVAVRRECIPNFLARRWPQREDLVRPDGRSFDVLRQFCQLRDAFQADQGLLVSYRREAYVNEANDAVRVTLDRAVTGGHFDEQLRVRPLEARYQPSVPWVILELKFTDRFPVWMRELAWHFNLIRTTMAKYVTCAVSLDRQTRRVLAA